MLDEARMGGSAAAALERQRVNLTLEVDGGMWMSARPRRAAGAGGAAAAAGVAVGEERRAVVV